jgi:hypothetical protein
MMAKVYMILKNSSGDELATWELKEVGEDGNVMPNAIKILEKDQVILVDGDKLEFVSE